MKKEVERMNYKEFLKPNKMKIILFLLIPVFYVQTVVIMCVTMPCPQPHSFLPAVVAVFFYIKYPFQANLFFYIIAGAVVSYLLSCLILFCYRKIIRKVKK